MLITYVCPDGRSWGQQTRAVAICRVLQHMGHAVTIVAPRDLEPLREWDRKLIIPLWQFPDVLRGWAGDVTIVDAQPWGTGGPAWRDALGAYRGARIFMRRRYEPVLEDRVGPWLSLYDAVIDVEDGALVRDAHELLPRHKVRQALGVRADEVAVLLASTPRDDVHLPFRLWVRAACRGVEVRLVEARHFPLLEVFEGFDAAVVTGGMLAHEVRVSGLPHICVPANSEQALRVGPRPSPEVVREFVAGVTLREHGLVYRNPARRMALQAIEAVSGIDRLRRGQGDTGVRSPGRMSGPRV